MAVPTIEEEVISSLPLLDLDQLNNVYGELGVPAIEDPAKKVKAHLMRKILSFLASDAVSDSEDGGLAHFQMIKTFMDTQGVQVKKEEVVVPVPALAAKVLVPVPTVTSVSGTAADASKLNGYFTTDVNTLKSVLKKDFKIKGKIGAPGQKDRMKFSQVAYAINNAEKKGYTEEEICAGVIEVIDSDMFP